MGTRAAPLDESAREAHVAPVADPQPSSDSPEPVSFALAVRRYAEALMMVGAST
jgi:hypothetical protein